MCCALVLDALHSKWSNFLGPRSSGEYVTSPLFVIWVYKSGETWNQYPSCLQTMSSSSKIPTWKTLLDSETSADGKQSAGIPDVAVEQSPFLALSPNRTPTRRSPSGTRGMSPLLTNPRTASSLTRRSHPCILCCEFQAS